MGDVAQGFGNFGQGLKDPSGTLARLDQEQKLAQQQALIQQQNQAMNNLLVPNLPASLTPEQKASFTNLKGESKLPVFKELGKTQNKSALTDALQAKIQRIADPVDRAAFAEQAKQDPHSAMSGLISYENTRFSQGMQGVKESRAKTEAQISANEKLQKGITDDPTAIRAQGIQQSLVAKNFVPGDENLPPGQFRQKFGFDKKESSNIQLQLKNHLAGLKQGGIFGIGADYPSELKANPQLLLKDVPSVFASPEALAVQQKNEQIRQQIQQQNDQLNQGISKAPVAPKRAASPTEIQAEIARRGLLKKRK